MLYMIAALAGEFLLLVLVFLLVAFVRSRAQQRRDTKAARGLVARIKQGKAEREAAITRFLTEGAGLTGEALDKAKVALLRAEFGFLQRLAGVYRMRESAAFARIDSDLYAAVEPYHAMTSVPAAAAAADGDGGALEDNAELELLRKENKRLSDELTITMETMSRMLNEYSTMFAGGDDKETAPIGVVAADEAAVESAGAADAGDDLLITGGGGENQIVETADDELAAAVEEPDAAVAAELVEEPSVVDEPDDDLFAEPEAVDLPEQLPDDDVEDSDSLLVAAARDDGDGVEDAEEAVAEAIEPEPEIAEPQQEENDYDDPIAAILREAESQEASARGEPASPSDDTDGGVLIEVGPAEVVAVGDEDQVADLDVDDIDDLFDAAEADDPEKSHA
jgi:hypothetical protein